MTSTITRILTLAAIALGVLSGAAHASSIVYVKDGNLWLTSPDGARGYRVTADGNWGSPSQADDGTLWALHGKVLQHLDRSGRALGTPLPLVGSDGEHSGNLVAVVGPLDPVVSPDGTRVAYWVGTKTTGLDWICNCVRERTQDVALYSRTDRYTPPEELGAQQDYRAPAWIDSGHTLLFNTGIATNVVLGDAAGGRNAMTPWLDRSTDGEGEAGAISRDGKVVAFVWNAAGANQGHLVVGALAGSVASTSPQQTCSVDGSATDFVAPTVAPDGSAVAFEQRGQGIRVLPMGAGATCDPAAARLLIPGGSHPSFGPVDVDMSQAPRDPSAAPAPTGTPARTARPKAPSGAKAVRRGGRITVTFTAPAGTKVRAVLVRGARTVRTLAARGSRVRLSTKGLRRGRYAVVLTAVAADGTTSVPVAVRFRIR